MGEGKFEYGDTDVSDERKDSSTRFSITDLTNIYTTKISLLGIVNSNDKATLGITMPRVFDVRNSAGFRDRKN